MSSRISGIAYLPISQSWRRNWPRIIPFFDYPPEIRKVIYTTNAIESVNMSLRKITKNRGSFPSDEALLKLFYLALRNISQKWTMPIRDWKAALTRFTIQFEERINSLQPSPRLHTIPDTLRADSDPFLASTGAVPQTTAPSSLAPSTTFFCLMNCSRETPSHMTSGLATRTEE